MNKEKFFEPEKLGLSTRDYERIKSVFYIFDEVEKVLLYGSRAKKNFKTYSDIDLTLIGNQLNLKRQHQIEMALDDLNLPYKFDVSICAHINNVELLDHINRVGIIIFQRDNSKIKSSIT